MPPMDRYAHFRRTHLTASKVPSPISYVQELYTKLSEKLPTLIQEEVQNDVHEYVSIMSESKDDRTNGEDTTFLPPMYWHPRTIISAGGDLNALRQAAIEHPPPLTASSIAEKVVSYWTSANSLKQLHRFVDSRQPNLLQIPLPDGSNISEDPNPDDPKALLPDEWRFRRALVRFLHLPGLWFSGENPNERVNAFACLYGISRLLLELELENCPSADNDDEKDDYPISLDNVDGQTMDWIKVCRNNIEQILDEIAKIAYEEQQTIGSRFFPKNITATPLTKEERLQRNLSHQFVHGMLEKVIKKYEELMAPHPFERLIMDLLDKEDTFERLLSVEHVEDKLINKQVVPVDELDLVQGPDFNAFSVQGGFRKEDSAGSLLEKFIYKTSASISMVNRQRRNFRLMREWIGERPWFLIVHVYDSSIPGNEWQADAIKEFVEKGLRTIYEDQPFNPSHYNNVRGSLFGIYPFDIIDPRLQKSTIRFCGLCNNVASGGNETINTYAILGCPDHHNFHIGCLISAWDREGKYTHSCPTCGMAPELSHIRLGMFPNNDEPCFDTSDPTFVDNAWGYIIKHPEHPAKAPISNYDMPRPTSQTTYWMRENVLSTLMEHPSVSWFGEDMNDEVLNREAVTEFDRVAKVLGRRWQLQNIDLLVSEDYVMEDRYDASRFPPSVEVAWLRKRRRRRDRIRRRKIAEAGQGLARYRP